MSRDLCSVCKAALRPLASTHLCGSSACVRAWRLGIPLEQAERELVALRSFDEAEISQAQAALDLHPDASPFWDSAHGQDALYVARHCKLTANNTNGERRRLYAEAKRAALAGDEVQS